MLHLSSSNETQQRKWEVPSIFSQLPYDHSRIQIKRKKSASASCKMSWMKKILLLKYLAFSLFWLMNSVTVYLCKHAHIHKKGCNCSRARVSNACPICKTHKEVIFLVTHIIFSVPWDYSTRLWFWHSICSKLHDWV